MIKTNNVKSSSSLLDRAVLKSYKRVKRSPISDIDDAINQAEDMRAYLSRQYNVNVIPKGKLDSRFWQNVNRMFQGVSRALQRVYRNPEAVQFGMDYALFTPKLKDIKQAILKVHAMYNKAERANVLMDWRAMRDSYNLMSGIRNALLMIAKDLKKLRGGMRKSN